MERVEPVGPRQGSVARSGALLLLIACALTLLNAAKPLAIDDPFIYRVAEQIASHPTDPYGFDIFWLQWPQPVHEELTPPLLPYWWAVGLHLFGERPLLWKLWLFPFALLLTFAFHGLARRYAPGVELPLTLLTLLSPTVLPGFNLMQDIPALALGLTGLVLYLRACDRDSLLAALGAGLVAGLATQTKYTCVALLGAMLLHGLLYRRIQQAVGAVSIAVLIFFGWEWAMTLAYGQGMFFGQVNTGLFWFRRVDMLLPLVRLLGAGAPIVALLGLSALGLPSRWVRTLTLATLAAFASLFRVAWEAPLFTTLGSVFLFVLPAVCWRLLGDGPPAPEGLAGWRARRAELWLIGWLAIELAVFFAAAPFPAMRRVLGIVVVGTLLVGRLVAVGPRRRGAPAPWTLLTAAGVALGLLFFVVDLREARAQRTAVQRALATVEASGSSSTIWFLGHWGFQFYAERAGMRPVVPDSSRLSPGDWLVVPLGVDRPQVRLSSVDLDLVATLVEDGYPPLRTGYGYYGAALPLAHRSGPLLETRVYRVRQSVVPRTSWSARQLADWVFRSAGRTAAAAVPALTVALVQSDAEGRALSAAALARLGPLAAAAVPALGRALHDPQATVRLRAAEALGRIGAEARAVGAALAAARTDPDPRVRAAVLEALERLDD